MGLFILTETSAGYALLKSSDKKLLKRDDIAEKASTPAGLSELLHLKKFEDFDSAATALEEATAIGEGKVTPRLAALLNVLKDEKKVSLAVADPKLGNAITKLPGLSIAPVSDSTTVDVFRAVRENLGILIPDALPEAIQPKNLGLSHSLSRHKLKFSPEKVDVMIIQAIALLDDLDKELNMYAMRTKEWYGWHFPEMAKIINDNLAYARVVLAMGIRSNAVKADLAAILPEEIEVAIKAAAEISMGTEITDEDLDCIKSLAEQVVELTAYRTSLSEYLSSRMQAIAPNLTTLVGDLVGARLIAHAGSVMNLAKAPASTIQILGAEKALFRALKTKHETPKYGLIFHSSLVGQASGKNKGKIARVLAAKAALGLRIDALADWGVDGEGKQQEPSEEEKMAVGIANRLKVERRLRALEGKPLLRTGIAIGPGGQVQPSKFEIKEARKYNHDADGLKYQHAVSAEPDEDMDDDEDDDEEEPAKPAKKLIEVVEDESEVDDTVMTNGTNGTNGVHEETKAERKARKAARKLEKEAKKAAKAARKAAQAAGAMNGDGKKRKHASEALNGDLPEKKKKKKKHAE